MGVRLTARSKKRRTKTYVPVYTKSDFQRDEKSFNQSIKTGNVDFSSFQRLMMNDLCTNTSILNTYCIGDVNVSDIDIALKHPKQYWRTLLKISEQLMLVSPHYYRMCNLFSNMPLFCWWVDLYGVKENANITSIKKTYANLTEKLESMNLKHEFSKIMKLLPYQDVYCGLVFENSTDFFFQQIDLRICEIYQVQDGLYNFRINLLSINPTNLNAYPDYVQQAFVDYKENIKNGITVSQWYEPPSDKHICIKLNSQWTFPYPFLIGLIKDIFDLDTYKKLKLQSARTDNYKAIAVEVPIDENTIDKPLLTPETLGIFAEINRESMSDDIGLIHTLGSNAVPISFKDSSNTRNNVGDAVDEIYNSSGISKELGNGSSSGTALMYSVENDSGFVYSLYRQLERWINRFIKVRKYNKAAFKFYFYLLDITIFNKDNVSKRYKESAALGIAVDKYLSSLDLTPSRTQGSFILQKDIFDFQNNFVPLKSAFNSSTDDANGDGGRPTNKSKNEPLDEAGEKTEKNDSNSKR